MDCGKNNFLIKLILKVFIYIIATNLLNLYKHFLSFFWALKAGILKHPGIKFNPKGYIIDNAKLNKVFSINIIWVFLYTAQKPEIKYQKNIINIKLKIKNIINFIIKNNKIFLPFNCAFSNFFSFFIDKICNSDKDNLFKIILIIADIIVEYNILGIWKIILNIPLSSVILCIVSSVKKKALTVKYNEKDNKSNDILMNTKL